MSIKPKKNHPVNHYTLPPFSGPMKLAKSEHWHVVATVHDEVVVTVPDTFYGKSLADLIGPVTVVTQEPKEKPKVVYDNFILLDDTESSFGAINDWYKKLYLLGNPDPDETYKEKHTEAPSPHIPRGVRRMRAEAYVNEFLDSYKGHREAIEARGGFSKELVLSLMTRFASVEVELTVKGEEQTEERKQAARIDALRQVLNALPSTDRDGRLFREDEL